MTWAYPYYLLVIWYAAAVTAFKLQSTFFIFGLSAGYSRKERFTRAIWLKVVSTGVLISLYQFLHLYDNQWHLVESGIDPSAATALLLWLSACAVEIPLFCFVSPKQNYSLPTLLKDLQVLVAANFAIALCVLLFAEPGGFPRLCQESCDLLTRGHSWRITDLRFSSDGKTLASVSEDNTINFWNAENGNLLHSIHVAGGISRFNEPVLSPDLRTVVIFRSADERPLARRDFGPNTAHVLDATTGKELFALHCGSKDEVSFNHASTMLATIDRSGGPSELKPITLRDPRSGLVRATISPNMYVDEILFSDDGKKLLCAHRRYHEPSQLNTYEVSTSKLLTTCRLPAIPDAGVNEFRQWQLCGFDSSNKVLGCYGSDFGSDTAITILNLATGQREVFGEHARCLAISPDKTKLVSLSPLTMYDFSSRSLLRQSKDNSWEGELASFSPDSQTLATAHADNFAIKLWDVRTGRLLRTIEHPLLPGLTADAHHWTYQWFEPRFFF